MTHLQKSLLMVNCRLSHPVISLGTVQTLEEKQRRMFLAHNIANSMFSLASAEVASFVVKFRKTKIVL